MDRRMASLLFVVCLAFVAHTVRGWWTSPRTHRYVTVYKLVECYCDVVCKEGSKCTWNCPNACSNSKKGKRSMMIVKVNTCCILT